MRVIRTVVGIILVTIMSAIVLGVLAFMLLIGGCFAVGAFYAAPTLSKDQQALEQARHAPLPPHVQRLIEDEYLGFSSKDDSLYGAIYSSDGGLAEDPSGRYMLTIEGLFDFASARLTRLDCRASRRAPWRLAAHGLTFADSGSMSSSLSGEGASTMSGRCNPARLRTFDVVTLAAAASGMIS